MRICIADYETYFADDFTLSKMTTEAYIRDHRFEAHGKAFFWPDSGACYWVPRDELKKHFAQNNWADTMVIHHHAHFDSLIDNHHYGVRPKLIGCTLSMARLMLGNHLSVSLGSVRRHFGIPAKTTPYNLFKGKRWHELTPDAQRLVGEGACDEVRSIWTAFQAFMQQGFPREELRVIDATVRMFSEPCLQANTELLAQIWETENRRKVERMQALAGKYGMTVEALRTSLQSADKFAALLEQEGVEPDTKDGKNGPIYAFGKHDPFMVLLLEDEDDDVRTLAEARIDAKSTALQTRTETLGFMASRGPLCVYLRMYGAHTTRWSGGDGCLTEDTRILVFDYQKGLTEKRIVDILRDDLIWDGEEFVAHGGVAFRGYQEVITHDGVEGTPEHVVFTCKNGEITLACAAETSARIMDCRPPKSREVDAAARRGCTTSTVPMSVRKRKGSPVRRTKSRKI